MAEKKRTVLIEIDFNTNEEIKTATALKRFNKESEQTAQDVIAEMVEERHQLEKELIRKGWSYKELMHFLNKKKYVQPA